MDPFDRAQRLAELQARGEARRKLNASRKIKNWFHQRQTVVPIHDYYQTKMQAEKAKDYNWEIMYDENLRKGIEDYGIRNHKFKEGEDPKNRKRFRGFENWFPADLYPHIRYDRAKQEEIFRRVKATNFEQWKANIKKAKHPLKGGLSHHDLQQLILLEDPFDNRADLRARGLNWADRRRQASLDADDFVRSIVQPQLDDALANYKMSVALPRRAYKAAWRERNAMLKQLEIWNGGVPLPLWRKKAYLNQFGFDPVTGKRKLLRREERPAVRVFPIEPLNVPGYISQNMREAEQEAVRIGERYRDDMMRHERRALERQERRRQENGRAPNVDWQIRNTPEEQRLIWDMAAAAGRSYKEMKALYDIRRNKQIARAQKRTVAKPRDFGYRMMRAEIREAQDRAKAYKLSRERVADRKRWQHAQAAKYRSAKDRAALRAHAMEQDYPDSFVEGVPGGDMDVADAVIDSIFEEMGPDEQASQEIDRIFGGRDKRKRDDDDVSVDYNDPDNL